MHPLLKKILDPPLIRKAFKICLSQANKTIPTAIFQIIIFLSILSSCRSCTEKAIRKLATYICPLEESALVVNLCVRPLFIFFSALWTVL